MTDVNLYKILELNNGASISEVKKAYKKLVLKYHPDKNSEVPVTKFYSITTAYNILSDIEKKRLYDETGFIESENNIKNTLMKFKVGVNNFFNSVNNIYDSIFNSHTSELFDNLRNDKEFMDMIKTNPEKAKNYLATLLESMIEKRENSEGLNSESLKSEEINTDIIINVNVTIKEVINGICKVITFTRQCFKDKQMTSEQHKITVPICDDRVIFNNEGNDFIDEKTGTMVRGRVVVNIKCEKSSIYKRVNDYDIMMTSHITLKEVETGFAKKFKYLDEFISVKCYDAKEKIKENKIIIRNIGKGIKYFENGIISKDVKFGDLFIVLHLCK